jgi:hypothetical protein
MMLCFYGAALWSTLLELDGWEDEEIGQVRLVSQAADRMTAAIGEVLSEHNGFAYSLGYLADALGIYVRYRDRDLDAPTDGLTPPLLNAAGWLCAACVAGDMLERTGLTE